MKIKDIVLQIITLKQKYHLEERDATFENQRAWYTWALANGHIEFVEKEGKIIGFLEWVRLYNIPSNIYDIKLDHAIIKTGPILFVTNAIAEGKGVLNQLRKAGLAKNKNWQFLVWHSKAKNIFKIYKTKEIAYGN